ncbi:MAG: response regulator transcription factor [bacterium]|nr:response regulator transcription factor [bacterium]
MEKIINIINPSQFLLKKLYIKKYASSLHFKYNITVKPHPSSNLLIGSLKTIHSFRKSPELSFIPFIIHGTAENLNKSFLLGASDFLKEPWDINELEIRAMKYINNDEIIFEWGKIDFSNEIIKSPYHKSKFTVPEYKILSMLVMNRGNVISRDNLHYRLGIINDHSRIIDVYIHSIRSKLMDITPPGYKSKSIITTIRGKGYLIQ